MRDGHVIRLRDIRTNLTEALEHCEEAVVELERNGEAYKLIWESIEKLTAARLEIDGRIQRALRK